MEGPVLRYRVSWVSGGIILGVAFLADLAQFFLDLTVVLAILADVVTVIAEGIIWLFFLFKGVSFLRGKKSTGRAVWFMVTTVIEMIPILDALPTLTFDTWYNIVSCRSEDRQTFKQQQEQYAQYLADQSAQEEATARYYAQHLDDSQLETA